MDQGLENAAFISWFTQRGWWGNDLFQDPNQQVGSDFETSCRQAITISALQQIQNAAQRALKWMLETKLASKVVALARNPASDRIEVAGLIEPPGRDLTVLLAEKNGANWVAQKENPAYKRITDGN